jgi:drug/metabolite transporter (DMT)-like permease
VALPFAFGVAIYEGAAWSSITLKGWLAVSYVGLFEMGITFVLWLSALKLTQNTARISNLIFASPFISLMLLATVIGEEIHPSTLVGLMLIVIGLVVQQLKKKPKT